MSRYIDADAVIEAIQKCDYSYREYGGEWKYIGEYDKKMIIDTINKQPTADVVSKEKYDELNERYHRLLESAKILSDAVREYERREDNEQIH